MMSNVGVRDGQHDAALDANAIDNGSQVADVGCTVVLDLVVHAMVGRDADHRRALAVEPPEPLVDGRAELVRFGRPRNEPIEDDLR